MRFYYYGCTQKGKKHAVNEDALLVFVPKGKALLNRKGALFLIADGVGGHEGGALASQLATETIRDVYYSSSKEGEEALKEAFWMAHRRIKEKASELQNNMATTATALVLSPSWALFGHVGNTRLYLLRQGQLNLLSFDHTLVAELYRQGILSKEEIKTHPQRHILTQALGIKEIKPNFGRLSLRGGDLLMLSSDGVHDFMSEGELRKILTEREPLSQRAQKIMHFLKRVDFPDDASLILIEIQPPSPLH